jgi:hypothetical protein
MRVLSSSSRSNFSYLTGWLVLAWLVTALFAVFRAEPARAQGVEPPIATNPQLGYKGGVIIPNVQVIVVFWGSNVDPIIQANIGDYFTGITSSSYIDLLNEYSPSTGLSIGRGSLQGVYTINSQICPARSSCSMTDADVQSELFNQIFLFGSLPPPTQGESGSFNTLYMMYFPANVTVTPPDGSGTRCQEFCAYRGFDNRTSLQAFYAVVTEPCTGSGDCEDTETELQNAEMISSHVLADAITDPFPSVPAWKNTNLDFAHCGDGCPEVADICFSGKAYPVTTPQGTEYVQALWSNALNACVVSGLHPTFVLSAPSQATAGTRSNFTLTVQSATTGQPPDVSYTGTRWQREARRPLRPPIRSIALWSQPAIPLRQPPR